MNVHTTVSGPLGELLLVGRPTQEGLELVSLTLPTHRWTPLDPGPRDDGPFRALREQLDAYFAGDLKEFSYTPALSGTAFQRQVWAALDALPYGATTTYGRLNAALGGSPARARAVGVAIGANPVSILRPCHRVVGSNGSLTGYAGGLDAKRALLTLEGVLL
ncbi:methylated-DNA--[protein]-cysteine S-methyltransferase [Actinocorallia sp. A-T 12471]|uniref:methylated-DNA--[protein]-cysteine S-methyltransferase n=1 Tax=Actinocorallia sp. A-T 12471 TaxID=3089813 RepID=UPI0029D3A92B|nr:methylated-DNA--[protein]-cysteine S-methyltransferase [Actinocorallia sp. A-T 12471]MDX6742859.1 methylated-DNA--[protein]-cysteine S-methyltransferase [Actinocorallia sp. A-T 12471]